MVSRSAIEDIASRAVRLRDNLTTEEATKHALVLPFLQALGYDVFDPSQVMPEFTADYGLRAGEKVDYAVLRNGSPVILMECKKLGNSLDASRASQLARYFVHTPARIAVLTDGLVYKFFSDLDAENTMDTLPFLEIDLTTADQRDVQALGHFTKHSFNVEEARSVAANMKHIAGMKAYLSAQYTQPDDAFVRLLTRQVFTGNLYRTTVEHFTSLTKVAFHGFVNDLISETLQRASNIVNNPSQEEPEMDPEDAVDPAADEAPAAVAGQKDIVTTVEELQGYELVKTILSEVVAPERVIMRDTQQYFGVALDSMWNPICRLRLNSPTTRHLVVMEPKIEPGERRKEHWHRIEAVNDIANYADELRETAKGYLEAAEE